MCSLHCLYLLYCLTLLKQQQVCLYILLGKVRTLLEWAKCGVSVWIMEWVIPRKILCLQCQQSTVTYYAKKVTTHREVLHGRRVMVFDHAPCFGDSTQVLTDGEIGPCSTVVAVVVAVVVLPDEEVDRPKPICRPPPYTHACRSPSLPPLQEERAHPFAGNGQVMIISC